GRDKHLEALIQKIQRALQNAYMRLDSTEQDARYVFSECFEKALCSACAEGHFLQRCKTGESLRYFGHSGPQPLAVLLRGNQRQAKRNSALNQPNTIRNDLLSLPNGRQQPFLNIHHHQTGSRSPKAGNSFLYSHWVKCQKHAGKRGERKSFFYLHFLANS